MPGGIDVKDYEGSHEVILPYDTRLPVLKWDQQIVAGAIGHLLTVAYDGQGINIEADRILIDKTSEPYVIITEEVEPSLRLSLKKERDTVVTLYVPEKYHP
jgi:hypothetical protein